MCVFARQFILFPNKRSARRGALEALQIGRHYAHTHTHPLALQIERFQSFSNAVLVYQAHTAICVLSALAGWSINRCDLFMYTICTRYYCLVCGCYLTCSTEKDVPIAAAAAHKNTSHQWWRAYALLVLLAVWLRVDEIY